MSFVTSKTIARGLWECAEEISSGDGPNYLLRKSPVTTRNQNINSFVGHLDVKNENSLQSRTNNSTLVNGGSNATALLDPKRHDHRRRLLREIDEEPSEQGQQHPPAEHSPSRTSVNLSKHDQQQTCFTVSLRSARLLNLWVKR